MKKRIGFLITLFLLVLTIAQPEIYKAYLLNLVELGLTFFFPAIFPTLLFMYILLDSGAIQELSSSKPYLSSFLATLIIAFGGTPVLLCFLPQIKMEKSDETRFIYRHIAPSFSFVFFLLKDCLTPLYSFLFPAVIMAIPIMLQLLFPIKIGFIDTEFSDKYSLIDSSIKSTAGAFKSLFNLMLMIALVGAIKPLFSALISEPHIYFFQGLLEYTSGSLELVKVGGMSDRGMLVFTLMFGGISSMFAIKKYQKDFNLGRAIIVKAIYALIVLFPLLQFLLQGLRN